MRKAALLLLVTLIFVSPSTPFADECMEGDCEDGLGTGFTDNNKIYEGEWQDGMPHGQGKLYMSKGKVVEGEWQKGELVKEKVEEKQDTESPSVAK